MPAGGVGAWFDLDGRTALVTGAGSGLGRAMARGLAGAGARVACADLDAASAASTVAALPGEGLPLAVDVADAGQVAAMVAAVVQRWGRLDVAFNNAGVAGRRSVAHEVALDDWARVLAVDLTGVFLCCREEARAMLAAGRGKIVNTASIWGLAGSRLWPAPAYAAAKGGVVNLTRELALEYAAHGITVNAIAPGFFRTGLAAGDPDYDAVRRPHVPLDRVGEPEDLEGVAVFLAARASDYVNGHVLVVDGGLLAY